MRAVVALAVLLASPLAAGAARAQGNYRSIPAGGRSALMGSTGIALSRDGSAPFLNPATLASLEESRVAASVNFYAVSTVHLSQIHQPGRVDKSLFGDLTLQDASTTEARFDALPSTFCLFLAASKGTLAFCFGTTERTALEPSVGGIFEKSGAVTTSETQLLRRAYSRVLVGPSYSLPVFDRLAFGGSLHLVDTSANSVLNATAITFGGGRTLSSAFSVATSATSFDLAALVGATYRIDPTTTIGVSVAPASVHLGGTEDATLASQFDGAGAFSVQRTGHGSFAAASPMRVGAGIGRDTGRVRVEGNVTLHFPVAEAFRSDLTVNEVALSGGTTTSRSFGLTTTERAYGVLNAGVGTEVFLSPEISLIGGINTDFTATPPLGRPPLLSGAIVSTRTSRAAMSFGIGSYSDASELLLGTELSAGWGTTATVNSYVLPNEAAVIGYSTFRALFIIAGTASLSKLRTTLKELRELKPPKL